MTLRPCLLALVGIAVGGLDAAAQGAGQEPTIRVALHSAPYRLTIGSSPSWRLVDAWGTVRARGTDSTWVLERNNRRTRAASRDGARATAWSDSSWTLLADGDGHVSLGARRYRGRLRFVATDTAIVVVNELSLDDYVRGVVALEIGARQPNERAAIEAQAIVARSYALVKHRERAKASWDLLATVIDQAYGGLTAESDLANLAVAATAGLVLTYGGQPVSAPYHSTCGGTTAAPTEVWSGPQSPWLQSVSDINPDNGRPWCSASPRLEWERTFTDRALVEAIGRIEAGRGASTVSMARVARRSLSGRVAFLEFETDRGRVTAAGNAIRFAFRSASGEILNSTYFSLEPVVGRNGQLSQLTFRGRGTGHGVGLCQWGAIGRARAGWSAKDILAAYYPGTTLSSVDAVKS